MTYKGRSAGQVLIDWNFLGGGPGHNPNKKNKKYQQIMNYQPPAPMGMQNNGRNTWHQNNNYQAPPPTPQYNQYNNYNAAPQQYGYQHQNTNPINPYPQNMPPNPGYGYQRQPTAPNFGYQQQNSNPFGNPSRGGPGNFGGF